METNPRRLHPLLTAAAVSVTVFSAVGVASLTGLIPHSLGSQKQETAAPTAAQEQASLQVPAEVAKPAQPVIAQPAPQPETRPVHKKPVVHKTPPNPQKDVPQGVPAEARSQAESVIAQPSPQPETRPVHKKPVVHKTAPNPATNVAYNDYGRPPPPPPHAQAP